MQKFAWIFGFLAIILVFQEIVPTVESSRVRIVKVRKSKVDKRQTQIRGYTDVPLDDSYDATGTQIQRPQDNPFNAGNRNIDYPLRNSNRGFNTNDQRDSTTQPTRRQSGSGSGTRTFTSKDSRDFDDGSYKEAHSDGDGNGIPGEPGTDYPTHASLPKTNFDCKQQQWPGYYADVDSRCQVFWICQKNRADAFLCPNGTLFNQQVFVCDWWFNVDCNSATEFYSRNQYIYAGPGVDLFGNPVKQQNPGSSTSNNRGNDNTRFSSSSTGTGNPRRPNTSLNHAQTTIIPLTNDFLAQDSSSSGNRNNYNRRAIEGPKDKKFLPTSKIIEDFDDFTTLRNSQSSKSVEIFSTSTPILDSLRFSEPITGSTPSRHERIKQSEVTTRKFEQPRPSHVKSNNNNGPRNGGGYVDSTPRAYQSQQGGYIESTSRTYQPQQNYPKSKSQQQQNQNYRPQQGGYSSKISQDLSALKNSRDDDAISPKDALRILSEIIASGNAPSRQSQSSQSGPSTTRNERKVSLSSYSKTEPTTTTTTTTSTTTLRPFFHDELTKNFGYVPTATTNFDSFYSRYGANSSTSPKTDITIGKLGATQINTTPKFSATSFTSPYKNHNNTERFTLSESNNYSPGSSTIYNRNEDSAVTTERHRNFNDFQAPETKKPGKSDTTEFSDDFENNGAEEFDGNDAYDEDLFEFKFAKTIVPSTTPRTTTLSQRIYRLPDEPVAETSENIHSFLQPTTFRPSFSETIKRIPIQSSKLIGTTTTSTISPPVKISKPLGYLETPVFDSFPTSTISPTFGKKVKSGRKRSSSAWTNYFYNNN